VHDHLGTTTAKDTVNAAPHSPAGRTPSSEEIDAALDILAEVNLSGQDRENLWR
jgi:hypothetical protein